MNYNKRLWLINCAAMILTQTACSTIVPVSEVAARDGNLDGLDSVVFVDKNLQTTTISKLATFRYNSKRRSKITLIDVGADHSATGYLRAWALLQNLSSHDLMLESRTSFFDAQQKPLQPTTAWQLTSAPRNSRFSLEAKAASSKAHHFLIELRQA